MEFRTKKKFKEKKSHRAFFFLTKYQWHKKIPFFFKFFWQGFLKRKSGLTCMLFFRHGVLKIYHLNEPIGESFQKRND